MARISQHEVATPIALACRHCHMPLGKWNDVSCIWRHASSTPPSRPIPPTGLQDWDFILGRIQQIRMEERKEMVENLLPEMEPPELNWLERLEGEC